MAIDPIQGLIDYVNEVKPFHTKILEVAVAYAQNDDVDITFTEDLALDISMFWPAIVGSPDEGPIRVCTAGYGVLWDRPTPYIVVDASASPQTISLDGDHSAAFAVGVCIEVREPYTDDFLGSPITESTPRFATMVVTSVQYDVDTNTTLVGVIVKVEGWLGSPIIWFGSPSVRPTSTSTFFPIMTDQLKSQNKSFQNMATIIISGEEYATRTVSIGQFGSPITADYVIVPPPTDSFDKTSYFVAPFRTNSSGSPAIADTGPYQDGKYYIEFDILDLEGPSNSGWGPYFGLGRGERTRADDRFTTRTSETVILDTYINLDIQYGAGSTEASGGSNRAIGHVFSMAIDYANSKVWFAQNGTWLGSGTQDPATNQGGYWPADFTSTLVSGADSHPHMIPMMWLFNQGTTSTGSPFNKPSTQDKIGIRTSSKYWSYTAPTGFGEWPEITSEPNVYEPGEQRWHYRDLDRVGGRPGDAIGHTVTKMSTFGDAAIAETTLWTSENIFYGLERQASLGGKFYMECTTIRTPSTSFGLFDADVLGSPIGVGSPYTVSGGVAYISPSDGQVRNSEGVPDATNDPTSVYRTGGVFETGNVSRDGRSSGSGSDGDCLMLAFDFDQNRMWSGVNGVWSWGLDPTTSGSPQGGIKLWNTGGSPDNSSLAKTYIAYAVGTNPLIYNLGGAEFYYTPPTGYEAWAYKAPPSFGSPLTIPSGSPPFSGNEFWFPPYSGDISGGDVFVVYNVVETNTLRLETRPIEWYGSPIVGSASPFTPIWPPSAGSPLPGSPKTAIGSPATYPNFGSPTPTSGNTITIKSTTPDVFLYGQEVEIRNAAEDTINRAYNIFNAVDLGGSPNLVRLTVLDSVLTDTTDDGELIFTPDGFSGGDLCGDVPPEILQTHWLEDLNLDWRFEESPLQDNFQHFILEADSTANTYKVQGDVSYLFTVGSPRSFASGSPLTVSIAVQHAVTAFGSPYESGNTGSPLKMLSANNGEAVIQSITYDLSTNRSTLQMDSVSANTPTGWINYNRGIVFNSNWAATPDTWVLFRTWDEGGVIDGSDLDSLFTNHTFPRITGFDITDDGINVLIANSSDDVMRNYTLSTPWDFSTATTGGSNGETNPAQSQWFHDDLGYTFFLSSADDLYSRVTNATSVTAGAQVSETTIDDADLGNTSSNDGPYRYNADGTALYIIVDLPGTVGWLRRFELSVPYDLSNSSFGSPQTYTALNVNAIGNQNALSTGLLVSPDEKYVIYTHNNFTYLGTMSVPGDVSTCVFDTVNTLFHNTFDGHTVVNPEFTKFYVCDTTINAPAIQEYNIP